MDNHRDTHSPRTRWLVPAVLLLLAAPGGPARADGWSTQDGRLLRGGKTWNATGYYPGLHSLTFKQEVEGYGITDYESFIDLLAAHHINLLRVVLTYHMAIEGYDLNSEPPPDGVVEIDLHFPYLRDTSQGLSTLHARPRTATGSTLNSLDLGVEGHWKFDLTAFDESFFDYWDEVVGYASSKGVVIQAVLFETHHLDDSSATFFGMLPMQAFHHVYDFFDGGNNSLGIDLDGGVLGWFADDPGDCAIHPNQIYCYQLAYVEKAVATLCRHENLIWEIGNEPPAGAAIDAWIADMAAQVAAVEDATPGCADHDHLIMGPSGANLDLLDHRDVPGSAIPGGDLDDVTPEDYAQMRRRLARQFHADGRPMIADNDCCFAPGTPQQQRWKAWTALVAGAHPSLFQYDMELEDPTAPSTELVDRLRFVGATASFLDHFNVDLSGLRPEDPDDPNDDYLQADPADRAWLLGRVDGQQLVEGIVYFFDAGSATLSNLPASYRSWWFDPINDSYLDGPTSGSLFATPTPQEPPFGDRDWALYIDGRPLQVRTWAVADAYVYEAAPTTNFGTAADLSIRFGATDFGRFSFLEFDLPNRLGRVGSARLRIRTGQTPVSNAAVYKMNGMSWSETGITWENWDQAGAVTSTPVASDLDLAAGVWHEIDVTRAVTSGGPLTLGIASGIDLDQDFHARESSCCQPQLIVERPGAPPLVVDAAADAWVAEDQSSANFGGSDVLRVRLDPSHHGKYAFLRFQVPAYPGTLVAARLEIHTRALDVPSAALYRMSGMDDFDEQAVNWLNWDRMGTVSFDFLGSTGVLGADAWHAIDVTAGGVELGSTLVLGLATEVDTPGLDFWSRESSYRPRLVITCQP